MEKIKFIAAQNEIQRIYSDFGQIVPVGDLSTSKAPGFKVYEVKYNEDGEDSAVNATIQIYCNSEGGGLYALYKTSDIEELFPDGVPTDYDFDVAINDPESQDPIKYKTQYAYDAIPFRKDMYTLSMPTHDAALPYDDYTLIMSIYSYTGGTTTVTSQFSAIAPPNWASVDEVLEGNKFIANGVEMVGEIETKDSTDLTVNERTVTVPAGYYAENASASVSSDYIIPTGSTTITNNGTDIDVAQYATVDVAVPVGPSDGGAVIDSVEVINDGGYECHVTFSTMPQLDTVNHTYVTALLAYFEQRTGVLAGKTCYGDLTSYPLNTCTIDMQNSTIVFFDLVDIPTDSQSNPIYSVPGYILIYEDGYDNLKYRIPCTVVNPDASI